MRSWYPATTTQYTGAYTGKTRKTISKITIELCVPETGIHHFFELFILVN
jgi:hypothetical protein